MTARSIHRTSRLGLVAALTALLGVACASTAIARAPSGSRRPAANLRADVVQHATGMLGTPYRYGGSSPDGFDCSGLVVYSYARAGLAGLPHSASALERRARRVSLSDIEPGDLLFFQLSGKKTSHVAIYVGDRRFVHAPSSGKRVERIGFEHAYWGPRLRRAGRLLD
jgi:cell wall-associated NlpC family hydrolase